MHANTINNEPITASFSLWFVSDDRSVTTDETRPQSILFVPLVHAASARINTPTPDNITDTLTLTITCTGVNVIACSLRFVLYSRAETAIPIFEAPLAFDTHPNHTTTGLVVIITLNTSDLDSYSASSSPSSFSSPASSSSPKSLLNDLSLYIPLTLPSGIDTSFSTAALTPTITISGLDTPGSSHETPTTQLPSSSSGGGGEGSGEGGGGGGGDGGSRE